MDLFDGISVIVKGSSHMETECQDFASVDITNENYAIAAVADGHGSKKHFRSSKGSQYAVQSAIETIQEYMKDEDKFLKKYNENSDYLLKRMKKMIITKWTELIEKDVQDNPITHEEIDKFLNGIYKEDKIESIYGTTLLVGFMSRECNYVLMIGDGGIVIINNNGEANILTNDSDTIANYTTSMSSSDAINDFKHYVIDEQPFSIMLSTDGLTKTFSSDDDFVNYNQIIAMEICKIDGECTKKDDIRERLERVFDKRSKQGSEDDISLAVIYNDCIKNHVYINLEIMQKINKEKVNKNTIISQLNRIKNNPNLTEEEKQHRIIEYRNNLNKIEEDINTL